MILKTLQSARDQVLFACTKMLCRSVFVNQVWHKNVAGGLNAPVVRCNLTIWVPEPVLPQGEAALGTSGSFITVVKYWTLWITFKQCLVCGTVWLGVHTLLKQMC